MVYCLNKILVVTTYCLLLNSVSMVVIVLNLPVNRKLCRASVVISLQCGKNYLNENLTQQKGTMPSMIDIALRMRREEQVQQMILVWAVLNGSLAGMMYTTVSGKLISRYYNVTYWPICYIELALAFLFSLNALFDVWKYYKYTMTPSTIAVSPYQYRLLGLRNTSIQASPPQKPENKENPAPGLLGQSVLSFSPSRPATTSPIISPSFVPGYSPPLCSPSTPNSTGGPFSSSVAFGKVWNYSPSPGSSPYPSSIGRAEGSNPGAQCHTSPAMFNSPGIKKDYIDDLKSLERFLHQEEGKAHRSQLECPEFVAPYHTPTFRNYNCSAGANNHSLRKFQYQSACRSQAPSAHKDGTYLASNQTVEKVWARLSTSLLVMNRFNSWTAKLRTWISDTILVHLVKEIDSVNSQLRRMGCPELQIGKLAHNGCMGSFHWNRGGDLKKKKWDIHLPTDSAILMHMFCTYLDHRLPPNPKYPDGKTFTSQHFSHYQDKPDGTKENFCRIHQSSTTPPHYQLIYQGHIYSLPTGRNNLFHTILMFLYIIKNKESGMLGRVNLGLSGVNILWIFED
ncbi:transmembrane protein 209 isoform X2 [Pleuronectes platessa]|uniref:transmembrane protein 209 isoform X2 n=1 Tax=Pleuronectes platessa TaxID=8262 RepID=UPI00232A27D3|nr:transmembrane protein 209 isoform X2 [Pleuronectes platessa]